MSVNRAREVLRIESEAIADLIKRIDSNFEEAVELLFNCKGKVVIMGMGKPGIIGQKLSATLASTGTPSLSLHPADAIHGDLGRISKEDVVIAISNSGETEEIIRLLPTIKKIGVKLISLTGNINSALAQNSDVALDVGVKEEAGPLGLAPTASTTAMLAMGDALAITLLEKKGFKEEDFAFYHPGGNLGKKLLLKVEDIMRTGKSNPIVKEKAKVADVLLAITSARAGAASVVDQKGVLIGLFTDGDLRRHLEKNPNLAIKNVSDVMTKTPRTITKNRLAAEAMRILQENKIDELPVVDHGARVIGMLDIQDLLKAGIF